jgi:hypothetical protein
MGQRVYIFGCDSVSTKSPIVNVPNRIVNSGHSGHYTLKGAINMRYSPFGFGDNDEQQYTPAAVQAIFENAKGSLPNKSGLAPFDKCIACLYYARATRDDAFMRFDPTCSQCYTDYCFQP